MSRRTLLFALGRVAGWLIVPLYVVLIHLSAWKIDSAKSAYTSLNISDSSDRILRPSSGLMHTSLHHMLWRWIDMRVSG
jgi:hypothetical protein